MKIEVRSKKNEKLAIIDCSQSNVFFDDSTDQNFKAWLENKIATGITRVREEFDRNTGIHLLKEDPIEKNDINYCLALKDFIKRFGYEIVEQHPEIENEIKKILDQIPDTDENKKTILKKLPELSYLDKTAILEELKSEELG